MQKIILFLFITFSSSSLLGQVLNPNVYWVATESRSLKGGGIFPMDGTILNFDEDVVYLHHIFYDSNMVFNSKVTKKSIRLDRGKWGTVKHWNNDSLVLVFDRRMLVKFVPVSDGECDSTDLAFWEYGDYVGKDTLWEFGLKLYDDPWVLYPNDIAKECIVQVSDRRFKYSELEKWSVIALENIHLFSLTFGQFEPRVFLVTGYHNDTARLELLGAKEEHGLFLAKKPTLSKTEFTAIRECLTKGRWKTDVVVDYATPFDNDTIEDGLEMVGSMITDTTFIKKSSLLNNQLSFEFSGDGKYKIFEDEVLMLSGDWKLMPSGNEIALGKHVFIDILDIKEDTLTIGKFDKFDIGYEMGREKGDYMLYYYRLKLIIE